MIVEKKNEYKKEKTMEHGVQQHARAKEVFAWRTGHTTRRDFSEEKRGMTWSVYNGYLKEVIEVTRFPWDENREGKKTTSKIRPLAVG